MSEQQRAHLLEQALTAIRRLEDSAQELKDTMSSADWRQEPTHYYNLRDTYQNTRGLWVQLMIDLLPYVPEQRRAYLLEQAWTATRELGPGKLRARLLAALAPSQPETVLAVVRSFHVSWEREEVLKALAPHCPEAVLVTAYELNSPEVMTAVIPHLRLLSNHDLYLLWRSQVRHFSTFTRPELMSNLLSLSSVIEKLGATQAFEDTLKGVQDVTT